MLELNYQPDDYLRIIELIQSEHDEEAIHGVGLAVEAMFRHTNRPETLPAVVMLYERNPCATCRSDHVRHLIAHDALAEEVARECLWDADLDTRAAAREYLARLGGVESATASTAQSEA